MEYYIPKKIKRVAVVGGIPFYPARDCDLGLLRRLYKKSDGIWFATPERLKQDLRAMGADYSIDGGTYFCQKTHLIKYAAENCLPLLCRDEELWQ